MKIDGYHSMHICSYKHNQIQNGKYKVPVEKIQYQFFSSVPKSGIIAVCIVCLDMRKHAKCVKEDAQ